MTRCQLWFRTGEPRTLGAFKHDTADKIRTLVRLHFPQAAAWPCIITGGPFPNLTGDSTKWPDVAVVDGNLTDDAVIDRLGIVDEDLRETVLATMKTIWEDSPDVIQNVITAAQEEQTRRGGSTPT